jgi:ParB/RepB/Spo0J family partition protein
MSQTLEIDAGRGVKQTQDVFQVDPAEVLVNEENRGRFESPGLDVVKERAVSMITHGQLQPVEVRLIDGNKIEIDAGFTRTAAARLIREGFTYNGTKYQDKNFKLTVTVKKCSEEDGFIHNIIENHDRNETSCIDDAYNQNRLREKYKYGDKKIAQLYQCSQKQVVENKRLLKLDKDIQQKVHRGEMSKAAAILLLDAQPEERREVLRSATGDGG